MLLEIINNRGDMRSIIIIVFAYLVILFIAFPIHECSHAFAAKLLGDDTAFRLGRVTLNPIPHLDVFGTIGVLVCGIGWAKPVPVNPTRARKVSARTAMALTAAAGPLSNLIVSYLFVLIGKLILFIFMQVNPEISTDYATTMVYILYAFRTCARINISLAIFNMLPIPPFDGSRIMLIFLKEKTYFKIMRYEQYIMFAILLIMLTGILDYPLSFLTNGAMHLLDMGTGFIPVW